MIIRQAIFFLISFVLTSNAYSQNDISLNKGKLIYENSFDNRQLVKDWIMEGPGEVKFKNGWMEMYSPEKKWDHVFWCPQIFPERFIAEWDIQSLNSEEGLIIVFFAATGSKGQSIFDPDLPKRDGTFKYYNRGQLNCYHISYYANNPKEADRGNSHLRKDPTFELLQTGEEGIPTKSLSIYHIRLIKDKGHIIMEVDKRKIIDYTDDGTKFGPVYQSGNIGFRQMRWSDFQYKNLKVWEIINH